MRAVMTRAAAEFVTPLSVAALTNERVFTDLFDLNDEREIGHIRLSRDADLIVVAPATADLLAKMAGRPRRRSRHHRAARDRQAGAGRAGHEPAHVAQPGDAAQRRAAAAPTASASSVPTRARWPSATRRARAASPRCRRSSRPPRDPAEVARSVTVAREGPLAGRHVLVTSGPTHEPIDPVRYIANRSSGKQGHAIAAAARARRARHARHRAGRASPIRRRAACRVETAEEMLAAVEAALPADVAMFAAAVADWRVGRVATRARSRRPAEKPPRSSSSKTPTSSPRSRKSTRPATASRHRLCRRDARRRRRTPSKKRKAKGADWIVANDVSPATRRHGRRRATPCISSPPTASRTGRR